MVHAGFQYGRRWIESPVLETRLETLDKSNRVDIILVFCRWLSLFDVWFVLFLGAEAPGSSIQLERTGKEGEGAGLVAFNPDVASSIARQRQRLPVYKVCLYYKIITVICSIRVVVYCQ